MKSSAACINSVEVLAIDASGEEDLAGYLLIGVKHLQPLLTLRRV
jgi:hypothetical protein